MIDFASSFAVNTLTTPDPSGAGFHRETGVFTAPESQAPEGFCHSGPVNWTTLAPGTRKRIKRMMGFGVMESPDRCSSNGCKRIPRQAHLDRLVLCSDAVAPESREASYPNRVGFPLPAQPFTQKQIERRE